MWIEESCSGQLIRVEYTVLFDANYPFWMKYVVNPISFQTFCTGILNCRRLLRIQYVIAIHLIRGLTNSYDFRLKLTATAAIGIYPTQARLLLLVNFENAIWT